MLIQSHFVLERPDVPSLTGTVHRNEDTTRRPVVVLVHGFKGFKDWGFFPYLADRLAQAGHVAIRVNFSLNGIGDEPGEFTRLDLFEQNSISQEMDDLNFLLDVLHREELREAGRIDRYRLGLVGHSRGGAVSLLVAAQNTTVSALATWSAVERWRYTESS